MEKVYSYDGPMPEDLASDPRIKHFTDKIKRDQQTFDDKPKGDQPKTLVEMTGRAVSASRKGLRNARGALGGGSSEFGDQPLPYEPLPLNQSDAPLAARLRLSRVPTLRIPVASRGPAAPSAVSPARAIAAW